MRSNLNIDKTGQFVWGSVWRTWADTNIPSNCETPFYDDVIARALELVDHGYISALPTEKCLRHTRQKMLMLPRQTTQKPLPRSIAKELAQPSLPSRQEATTRRRKIMLSIFLDGKAAANPNSASVPAFGKALQVCSAFAVCLQWVMLK